MGEFLEWTAKSKEAPGHSSELIKEQALLYKWKKDSNSTALKAMPIFWLVLKRLSGVWLD